MSLLNEVNILKFLGKIQSTQTAWSMFFFSLVGKFVFSYDFVLYILASWDYQQQQHILILLTHVSPTKLLMQRTGWVAVTDFAVKLEITSLFSIRISRRMTPFSHFSARVKGWDVNKLTEICFLIVRRLK